MYRRVDVTSENLELVLYLRVFVNPDNELHHTSANAHYTLLVFAFVVRVDTVFYFSVR